MPGAKRRGIKITGATMGNRLKRIALSPFRNHEQGNTAFQQAVEKLVLLILLVLPLGMIVRLFFQETDKRLHTFSGYEVVALIVALAAIVFLLLFLPASPGKYSRFAEASIVGAVCALAFVLRLLSVTVLQASPISDFKACYEYATSGENAQYMTDFHYLGFYALTIKAFMRLSGASVTAAQMYSVLITSAIPAVLYCIAKIAFRSVRIGALSALLYAVFPSMLIYVNVLSCENSSMFYLALSLLFLVLGWCRRLEGRRYIVCYGLAGISVGLMNLYKPLLIVVVAALAAVELLFCLLPALKKLFSKKDGALRAVLQPVLAVCLVAVLASAVTYAGQAVLYRDTGLRPAVSHSYVSMAFEGLYSKGGGSFDNEVKLLVKSIKGSSATMGEAERTMLNLLVEDIKKDPGAFKNLLRDKFIVSWCDEYVYTNWVTESSRSLLDLKRSEYLLQILPNLFYMLLIFGIIAGMAARVIRNRQGAYPYLLMSAIVLIVACMFLVIEAQGRYKSTIMPVFCVLSAVGFAETARFLKWGAMGLVKRLPPIFRRTADRKSD